MLSKNLAVQYNVIVENIVANNEISNLFVVGHIPDLVQGQDLEVVEVVDILGVEAGHMTVSHAVEAEVVPEAGQSQTGLADHQGHIQEHQKGTLKITLTDPIFDVGLSSSIQDGACERMRLATV